MGTPCTSTHHYVRIEGHHLYILTHVLHWVCFPIIDGEQRSREPFQDLCTFDLIGEW